VGGSPQEVFDIDALVGGVSSRATTGSPGDQQPPPRPPAVRRRRRSRWPWIVAAVVVLAAVGVGLGLAAANKAFTPSHPAPSLGGQTLAAARKAAAADHFTLVVQPAQHSITVAAGSVISQQPKAGAELKEGAVIQVVPSEGLPSVAVPSLSGLTCNAATRLLQEAHFKATCPALSAYTTAGTVPEGQIINWSYDNHLNVKTAPYGSTIAIAVSQGKKPVPVPTVANQTYTQAATAIKAAGLVPTETQAYSTTVPAGSVIGTTPPIGTPEKLGTTVTVSVSKGPQTVPVPNVTKDTVTAATTALQAAGLTVGQVYGPAKGKVFTTVPLATTPEPKGTAVNLYTQ
jgi:beta-lactam-binding protein with PASTA domain